MSRLIAVIVVIGALAVGAAAAAGRSAPSTPCGPTSARTLAVGRLARVYAVGGQVYGCATDGVGRRFALGTTNLCVRSVQIQAVAVAGRLAAFGAQSCGVDTGSSVVRVRRLTDGRTLFSHPAVSAAGPESYTAVSAIVADRAGDVAWIARTSSIVRHAVSMAVYAARGPSVRRLDSGPAIVVASLRLTGTTVRWRNARRSRSGRL